MGDFRNYGRLELHFSDGLNGIFGLNGAGKTNILDALHYICTTRSYFSHADQYNFRHECDAMELNAAIQSKDRIQQVIIKVAKGRRKEVQVNRVKESKLSEFIGRFPVVMIAPGDNEIINGGSEERRKLFDTGICQYDPVYTDTLLQYNKVLANRNALLKQMDDKGFVNDTLLLTLDDMLASYGTAIHVQRKNFLEQYAKYVEEAYSSISGDKEKAALVYQSHLSDGDYVSLLKKSRDKDRILHRTTKGVHLDDLELLLNGHPLKKVGSQGQQKTFVVALKLALHTLLKDRKYLYPVLLLDDIFEKFDQGRLKMLFSHLGTVPSAQVFITDTDEDRLREVLQHSGRPFKLIKVENGHASELQHQNG